MRGPGRRWLAPLALGVAGALVLVQLTGCAVLGFGIGSLVDMSNGKRTPDTLVSPRTGTCVTIWLHDGRKLHGRFLGSRDSLSQTPPPMPSGLEPRGSPPRAVVLIGTGHGIEQIPLHDMRRVSVPVARGKIVGFLAGLGADVLGILLFIAALSQVDLS